MYRTEAFFQTKISPGAIHQGIVTTASIADFDHLLVAVAYATERGCTVIDQSLSVSVPRWKEIEKHWLISFDMGLTEPSALDLLAQLPNSSVRIPYAEEVIGANLRPRTHFHNKVFLFEKNGQDGQLGIFSGSANLTFGGLFLNDEQGISCVWTPPLSKPERTFYTQLQRQKQILEYQFSTATVLSPQLLKRYRRLWTPQEQLREQVVEDEREIVRNIAVPNPVSERDELLVIATATNFWVDVQYVVRNRGSRLPGNQIDLKRGSRVFFGFSAEIVSRNTVLGTVRIRYANNVDDYSMRFGNNSMDKLNLPIPEDLGLDTFENKTLLFSRRPDGSFMLSIGSSNEIRTWREQSRKQGGLFRMQSGREFGVFS